MPAHFGQHLLLHGIEMLDSQGMKVVCHLYGLI